MSEEDNEYVHLKNDLWCSCKEALIDTCKEILDRCCSLNAGLASQLGVSDSCRSIRRIAPPCGDNFIILFEWVLQFPSAPAGGSPLPSPRKQLPWWHTLRKKRHIGLTFYLRGFKGEFICTFTCQTCSTLFFGPQYNERCLFSGSSWRETEARPAVSGASLMANATLASISAVVCGSN